jgi:hypothetical protein
MNFAPNYRKEKQKNLIQLFKHKIENLHKMKKVLNNFYK